MAHALHTTRSSSFGHRRGGRRRWPGTGIVALLGIVTLASTFVVLVAKQPRAGAVSTAGLNVIVSERGRISASYAAEGSVGAAATLTVDKPQGATVRRAILFSATTGFTSAVMPGPVTLNGQSVLMGHGTPSGISSYNFWTDVTTVVASTLNGAAAGRVSIPVVEPSPENLVDGTLLAVIYNDPNIASDQSVSFLFGALLTGGDRFTLALEKPFDPTDPSAQMQMSLGISYSCQQPAFCGSAGQQYSVVDVNGKRLTSAAGGEDDGVSTNGALITAGGVGDSPANPTDPFATPTDPRSDDELYDLKPFLKAGDTSIVVDTRNPSADDNVFFAAFTGNPPVSQIVTSGDKFVYVALGDSYQSGEGAGFNVRPSATYLSEAYENGTNFPPQTGPQDNTYTNRVTPPGDSCHRALLNYAKINRDKYKPGAHIVLVDRTCSGATIEPSGKPAIVGKVNTAVDPNSQIAQAQARLADVGLTADDVDLVTVGMGGNDAHFGDIVAACLIPGVLREILAKYPNSPGDIKWLANEFLTCDRVDNGLFGFGGFKTGTAIQALGPKETWAEGKILDAFRNAQVLQLDYPNILPVKSSPDYCGGLSKDDVNYALGRVRQIDDTVRKAIATTSAGNSRLSLVDVEKAFGPNALCPAKAGDRLANGITKTALDAEITRLLNLDGTGDATARAKVDTMAAGYRAYRNCLINKANPFDGDCNLSAAYNTLKAAVSDAGNYLASQQDQIFAELVSPPGTSDDTTQVGFDRSRGLFHPNDRGFAVLACHVFAAYQKNTTEGCPSSSPPPVSTVNGQFVGNTPVRLNLTDLINLLISGFKANSRVLLTLFSEPTPLGQATTNADGVLQTSLTLPPTLNPGVHLIEVRGQSPDGVAVTQQVRIELPGRPVGSYTTYLCCFTPQNPTPTADTPTEHVTVTLNGDYLTQMIPDEDGGLIVVVPNVNRLLDPAAFQLVATSDLTGKTITKSLQAVPTAASLWATSTDPMGVTVSGSGFTANGRVHSEGGVAISGIGATLTGGAEYVTTATVTGSGATVRPALARVSGGQGQPPVPAIADYRPGGRLASGSGYRAIPTSACVNGTWTPSATDRLTGVVYVPCGVSLGGIARTYAAQIVAEGPVRVSGQNVVVGTDTGGAFSILTAASGASAVVVDGRAPSIKGSVFAPSGDIAVSGDRATVTCGVLGSHVSVSGTSVSAPMTRRCLG